MARLPDQLGDWLARVEILARGAERRRAAAAGALAEGRPWQARSEALAILDELPRSRVALLLWADAAQAMMLDGEVAEALERLARELPFRADVWLRLAEARARAGTDPASALLRAAEAGEPGDAADRARLWLADLDLLRGDPERAERWLEQLGLTARASAEATLRRVEAWLDEGERDRARRAAAALPAPAPLDARGWLVEGRLRAAAGDPAAVAAFERALLLEAPRSGRVVADFVAGCRDADSLARLSRMVAELGYAEHPSWRAAFAVADGRSADAVAALADGARRDLEPDLLERYVAAALGARDAAALADAVALARARGAPLDPGVAALARALVADGALAALAELDGASGEWAAELRRATCARLVPVDASAAWRELLDELSSLARGLSAIDVLADIESIAVDLERPLRVAIVGEFNAGKSSFINALLGEAVAPVGVLPTTASVNHLVWAPDRFARVQRASGGDRVVAHAALRDTLRELDPASVERVTIYAPLELLRRVELIDTPGFNAPDPRHAGTARSAFADAHVVLWLLDANQPLKQSERHVMEEIRDLDLPLLVLVNKIDRLPDVAAVDAALAHVAAGLADAGLPVEVPPLAFSARLALDDPAAGERSRWRAVERLVEDVLFAQSARLRERALRRRAGRVASKLADAVRARTTVRERDAEARAAQRARLRAVATDARARAEELEQSLVAVVEAELDALAADLRPVSGGDVEDDALVDFVVARLRGPVGGASTRSALELVAEEDRPAVGAQLEPRVEAMAAALAPWLHAGGASRAVAARRLARQVVRELARVALALAGAPSPAAADPAEARAVALAAALHGEDPSAPG